MLRTAFAPFSCNNNIQIVRNEPLILPATVLSGSKVHDYGKQCLLAGQYSVKLEIPSGSAQQPALVTRRRKRALPDADIEVDSVSNYSVQCSVMIVVAEVFTVVNLLENLKSDN